ESHYQPDKAIRGGVPICFPWFGPKPDDPKAPAHGFARLCEWELEDIKQGEDGSIMIAAALRSDDRTRSRWGADFQATILATLGQTLAVQLEVTNPSSQAFTFEEALHSYLLVGDVKQVSVAGLGGAGYIDKTRQAQRFTQDDRPIQFVEETDRVYLETRAACAVTDPMLARRIIVGKAGSDSTVLWNPWTNKSKAMSDFGDDEWLRMLCVEACNVGESAVTLAPGASHVMTASVAVEQLAAQ
ncbi:MAG: D-hexose-6-phosphate mutarotase, partial [Tepidisphaeraceae bacterium]